MNRILSKAWPLIVLLGCSNPQPHSEDEKSNQVITELDYTVTHHGALREIMHENRIEARVDLSAYDEFEHFYALGAVEALKGEILVLNGQPYISSVGPDGLNIDTSFDYRATLLVSANVARWKEIAIPDTIQSFDVLEAFIAENSASIGLTDDEPFPFLIEGTVDSLQWHVINWPEGDTIHTHTKHVNSGINEGLMNETVTILGFYSDHHHGVFTHHSTNMHMHFLSESKEKSGHVDDLFLGNKMRLKLPAISE